MMVMMSEILGELKSSELVVRRDAPNHARELQVREVSIGGAARNVREGVGDVRDAHRAAERGEQRDDSLSPRGVALVDAAKVTLDEFVELRFPEFALKPPRLKHRRAAGLF
jgi:hypothetical protein